MLKIEFGMKKHIPFTGIWIAVALMALMVACDPKEKEVEPMEKPLPELAAIDSLIWKQPDSAFAVLKQFVASPQADSLDVFNEHYCQVLISELLYKKDYEQSNREALLKAVVYFDSLTASPHSLSQQERNVFLDARIHYINGVGFYEQSDEVNACAEYLKALNVMEGNFEDKELIGKKAIFMTYIYNRLGDMFEVQMLAEPAIVCYKQALFYCRREPTSKYGLPVLLYSLGIQYDIANQKDSAAFYYDEALANMPDFDNVHYRDIMVNKIVFAYYNLDYNSDSIIKGLKHMVTLSSDERERITRLSTLGNILFEDEQYDSSRVYLETVFEQQEDITSKIMAAENLSSIYQREGDSIKAQKYASFLVGFTMSEIEKKTDGSMVNEMFKDYLTKKQEKQAEIKQEKAVKKATSIIISIAVVVAFVVILVLILRSKKLLKKQQEEANRVLGETELEHEKELKLWQAEADKTLEETKKKYEEELRQLKADTEQQLEEVERKHQKWMAKTKERHEEELRAQKDQSEKEIEKTKKRHEEELETERLAYQKEQEALRQNLQQREEQVGALEKALDQWHEEVAKQRAAFLNEEICQRILELLHGKHITSRDTSYQHGIGLKEEDFKQLKDAVEQHYKGFDNMLLSQCASLKQSDLTLCHLHLLGLNEGEIGALKDRTYSAIKKQNENLQEKIGVEESLSEYVLKVAEGLCGSKNVNQKEEENMPFSQIMDGFEGQTEGISKESTLKSTLKDTLKGTQKTIVEIIINNPNVTIPEIARQLNLNPRGIAKHFKVLQDKGVIRRVGPDKGGHWEVIE